MATMDDGDNLSHSVLNAADEYFDIYCTPCSNRNLSKEGVKYCAICKEYFCVDCVDIHKSFKVLSKHVLVDPKVTQTSSSRSGGQIQYMPTELCKRHPHELITMYCVDDGKVGCSVCFMQDHKFGDGVKYIPEYIQDNYPTEQVQQITNDLIKAIKAMDKLKTQHDRLEDDLDDSKTACKQEIQNYRTEINQIIDKIEATTLTELDNKHKDIKTKTGTTNQAIHDTHDEMIRFKSLIESDQSNEAQKFVIATLSQILITQGRELQSEFANDQAIKLTFTRNTGLIPFLLRICTFGVLRPPTTQDASSTTAPTNSHQTPQTQSTSPSATTSSQQPRQTQSTSPSAATTNSQQPQSTSPSVATTSSQQPQSTSTSVATTSSQQPQSTSTSVATTSSQQPQSTSTSVATTSSQQPQSTSTSVATTSSQQPHSTSTSVATTSSQQPQSTSPSAATTSSQQPQSKSPSAATTSSQQPQQTQSTSPSVATTSSQQTQSTSPSVATTSSQLPQSTSPSVATTSSQQTQSTSPSVATTSSQQPQSTSPSVATTSSQQTQSTSPSATTSSQQTKSTSPSVAATSSQQPQQTQSTRTSAVTTSSQQTQSTGRQQDMKSDRPVLYKMVYKAEYYMRRLGDQMVCDIMSSCILDNGNIVLVDSNNNQLKLVNNRTYAIISAISLSAGPRSVCRVGCTEVAVCLYNNTIQFVSTRDDRLELVRSLSMTHKCRGIAVLKDKMYVGAGCCVRIYTMNGKHVNTIGNKSGIFSNRHMFSNIWDITVSDDQTCIHIADDDKGVITLNEAGDVVWRYSGSELGGAKGVCTDGTGNVIVCGRFCNVIQLAPDGKYIGEIVTRSHGVYYPRTVCFDADNQKLIVGQSCNIFYINNYNILVCTVNNK